MRYWTLGLAYFVLYVAMGWALGGHPVARGVFGSVGLAVPAALVLGTILYRRADWAGSQRLFWDTIAIGMCLWLVGHAGWTYDAFTRPQPTWLNWHTLFTVCGGICPVIALLARPHRGVRPDAVPALGLDIASYGLLALFVYTYFVLIPSLVRGAAPVEMTFFVLVQANRLVSLAAVILSAWLARRTSWRATYLRLCAGVAIGFLPRIATSLAILGGRYQSGSAYDLAWIGPWFCYAWAAAESPSSGAVDGRVDVRSPALSAFAGAIPVFAIPLIGYTSLEFGSIGTAGEAFRTLLTSVVTVAGLGLVTLRLTSQSSELQRADARVKLLAAATEQTRDMILITRADGSVEHANEACLRALGYERPELANLHFSDLVEPRPDQAEDAVLATIRERGVWRGTLNRRRRDGSTFPASCTIAELKDAGDAVTHYVGVERDITDELLRRDRLVQSERLAAMEELVAGVAHEINNPLQTIIGTTELMLEESPVLVGIDRDADSRLRDLEMVRHEAGRAGQIVKNLLSFVRRSARDRARADLNEIVRITVELRRYRLQQGNITTVLRCDPSPLPVLVNRDEVQQVILNLLLNAEQAIASASSDPGAAQSGTITVQTGRSGTTVYADVADDGPGVSPEARARIFEPFFTTKEVGEGTGLGLSISHGIASAHGGSLELRPSSRGAQFRLMLPAADAEARHA